MIICENLRDLRNLHELLTTRQKKYQLRRGEYEVRKIKEAY